MILHIFFSAICLRTGTYITKQTDKGCFRHHLSGNSEAFAHSDQMWGCKHPCTISSLPQYIIYVSTHRAFSVSTRHMNYLSVQISQCETGPFHKKLQKGLGIVHMILFCKFGNVIHISFCIPIIFYLH